MSIDFDVCYRALRARDARFDGLFFVGVKTTGIYCRSVCPARTPKAASCGFFTTAGAAEQAGFRPCLRCRPELAPGLPGGKSIEEAILTHLQEGALEGRSMEEVAAQTGFSSRHVRRMILNTYGVTPAGIIQTQRLLFAKKLLRETAMPVIDVALGSGFGSLRRFNALIRARYGLSPRDFRRGGAQRNLEPARDSLRLRLAYRPPMAWGQLMGYLSKRAIPGVEWVSPEDWYARTVNFGKKAGWVRVRCLAKENCLEVETPPELSGFLYPILTRLRRVFDLDANPGTIEDHLKKDALLRPWVKRHTGLRMAGAWDVFELAVRAVLGQQISVGGATVLSGRLAARFGDALETSVAGLSRLSPTAERLASAEIEEIAAVGIPRSRAGTIREMARFSQGGGFTPGPGEQPADAIEKLKGIRGIGEWTAQYIAMRWLRLPDAFPSGDLGLRKAMGKGTPATISEALDRAEPWRPWRAYAAGYLWQSLN